MVRVIPVHNFLEQNVAQIDEPTASCVANTDVAEYLLLASSSHCVEVRDLTVPDLKFLTAFPTVDLACQLVHCTKGNYVAALESKVTRDSVHTNNFVRVYVNWATQERQAMRARIAGRVTPSLNRPQNSLEMIELPLNSKPTAIACCQATGNLLVATGSTLILHEFKIETQNPSKLKFIDFEARPWSLGLHFSPLHLEIVEDFISVMDSSKFVVFRLTNPLYDDIDHLSSLTSTTSSSNDKTTISTDFCSMETMDNSIASNDSNLMKHKNNTNQKNVDRNSNPHSLFNLSASKKKGNYIDWDRLASNEKPELESLINEGYVEHSSQPFSINLPSISLERAGPGHTLNPFILNSADTEVFIKTTSPDNGWSENYMVKCILRLKIAKAYDTPRGDANMEFFTCSVLKPLYMKISHNYNGLKRSILRSEKYKYLNGVTCLICTTQEGYIYHFNTESSDDINPTCLTTYPFTAPVIHVALEYTVLHALTEAGLESYTLRLSHHIAKMSPQHMKIVCPDISEPVCLIGLRPFQSIQKLINSDKSITLLAKVENNWTLYSLILPKPENIYYDIVNAAKNHRTTSPSTYRHLLEEAHAMLRLAKDVVDLPSNNNDQSPNDSKVESLYNQSCALLGDYFIKSDSELERRLCIPYYKMSGLKPSEILSRKSTFNAPGLVTYIRDILMTVKSGPEADALFQSQDIVEIISSESREDLLNMVLGSVVLREYTTEKLIKLLSSQTKDDYTQLALSLLYIQAEKEFLAENALEAVSNRFLSRTVLNYPHLLFDDDVFDSRNRAILSFSDFAAKLICRKSQVFAEILTKLVEEEVLSLHQVMQVFLEYLPSRVGRDGHDAAAGLQQFLETYLQSYFDNVQDKNDVTYNDALVEAFTILVRSYLGKLMQSKVYKSDKALADGEWKNYDAYLFKSQRPKYLDKMPPCLKDYKKIMNALDLDDFSKLNNANNDKTIRVELLKLQALMASDFLPAECFKEVEQFLNTEEIDGSLAFHTLCNRNTEAVTQMLIEQCPQAVLQYAKDMYTKETEWKLLVDLLQQKISNNDSSQELHLFYEQTMIDTLKYAAEILPLKSLHYILPKDDDETFQRYIDVCGQIVHAEHVKSLLMETGRQLLSTLNL
ncbi:BLOC-2 complex member HPS3 [Phymastichus coffea]|uniref:BLOC-2 complex member HPS3 n=1 Tax=Phymastichus coffea TaxID=108790 RepID=UPI00273C2A90|nr:BLOC-2 complex member HPS3 [Phymastichus coffea]